MIYKDGVWDFPPSAGWQLGRDTGARGRQLGNYKNSAGWPRLFDAVYDWSPMSKFVSFRFRFCGKIRIWRFGFAIDPETGLLQWAQWGPKPEGCSPRFPFGWLKNPQ